MKNWLWVYRYARACKKTCAFIYFFVEILQNSAFIYIFASTQKYLYKSNFTQAVIILTRLDQPSMIQVWSSLNLRLFTLSFFVRTVYPLSYWSASWTHILKVGRSIYTGAIFEKYSKNFPRIIHRYALRELAIVWLRRSATQWITYMSRLLCFLPRKK